jgi:hypothetical protein
VAYSRSGQRDTAYELKSQYGHFESQYGMCR